MPVPLLAQGASGQANYAQTESEWSTGNPIAFARWANGQWEAILGKEARGKGAGRGDILEVSLLFVESYKERGGGFSSFGCYVSACNAIAVLQPEHETSQSREVRPSITLLRHNSCTSFDEIIVPTFPIWWDHGSCIWSQKQHVREGPVFCPGLLVIWDQKNPTCLILGVPDKQSSPMDPFCCFHIFVIIFSNYLQEVRIKEW